MIKLPFNALHTWTHVDWNRVSVRYMVDPTQFAYYFRDVKMLRLVGLTLLLLAAYARVN